MYLRNLIILILTLISYTLNSQSLIEIGSSQYLNRSDQFHWDSYHTRHFAGFAPYVKYYYEFKGSLVLGAGFSYYTIGTKFDVKGLRFGGLSNTKNIIIFKEKMIDANLHIGYKIRSKKAKFNISPSAELNLFAPDYVDRFDKGAYDYEYIGDRAIDINYIDYYIYENHRPFFTFGYTFNLAFEYLFNKKYSFCLNVFHSSSYTNVMLYNVYYGFFDDIEERSPDFPSAYEGYLTNNNTRYGIEIGITYTIN